MVKKEITLVPYENTIYDILIDNLKGKYFQSILFPSLIAQIPKDNQLNICYVENGKLSVWLPLEEKYMDLDLKEFRNYALISEEQFNSYKDKTFSDLSDLVLAHKDSPAFKNNKPNLSAQNSIGLIVDKSKATSCTEMYTKPFPEKSRSTYLRKH